MIWLAIALCVLVFGVTLLLCMRRSRQLDERDAPYIGEFRRSDEP